MNDVKRVATMVVHSWLYYNFETQTPRIHNVQTEVEVYLQNMSPNLKNMHNQRFLEKNNQALCEIKLHQVFCFATHEKEAY